MRFVDAIRSVFFNLTFYLFTILFLGLVVLPLCLARTEGPVRWGVGIYCAGSIMLARIMMGIRLEIRGLDNIPSKGGLILAAAHQSNMDPMIAYCIRGDVTALAKKELFATPLVGQALRKMNIVRIDRQAKNAHKDMLDIGREVVALGRPLIVYPQATRMKPGTYRKLKSGAYFLHQDTDLPVIPVATNTGLFWRKGFWHRSGTAVFEIGEAFPRGLDKDAFMARLEADIVERSDDLIRGAGFGHLLSKPS